MRGIARLLGPALILAAGAAVAGDPVFKPPPAKEGYSYPDCYCTNRGEKVPVGAYSCLKIGSKEYTARCGMSLNNPAWRDKTEGCQQPLSRRPALYPAEPV